MNWIGLASLIATIVIPVFTLAVKDPEIYQSITFSPTKWIAVLYFVFVGAAGTAYISAYVVKQAVRGLPAGAITAEAATSIIQSADTIFLAVLVPSGVIFALAMLMLIGDYIAGKSGEVKAKRTAVPTTFVDEVPESAKPVTPAE
jgi:hypothetical protein